MARLRTSRQPIKPTIDKFFGLNLTGETQLVLGESPNMENFRITDNYDLEKMYGYTAMLKSTASPIRGMWHGIIGSTEHFLFASGGHIYKVANGYWDDDTQWETTNAFTTHCTDLGTLTDATTRFFEFGGKLYIQNGTEYKVWTGTGNIATVTGYVPKVAIGCTPATGAGTEYEVLNALNGKKRKTYNGNGSATAYLVGETSITSVDAVYVDGVLKTLTTHYTVNTTTGTVTFTSGNIPANGLDNVEIYWTKGSGTPTYVTNNKANVQFKNRIFMYGNGNTLIWSELADGVPSAEYFPVTNFSPVGSENTPITDVSKGYDRLVVTKPNAAFYCLYDIHELDGLEVVNFPIYDLNATTGNIAFAQGQIINNYPVTLENGIQLWNRTDVKDERNVSNVSLRIQKELNGYDLSDALTLDVQHNNEYWLSIGTKLYIYNYALYGFENSKQVRGVFSKVSLEDTPTCFIIVDGEVYFGTSTTIMKFSVDALTYNGSNINAHWESGFMDFGANYMTKSLNKVWIGLKPQTKTRADISFVTDVTASINYETVNYQYAIFQLGQVDFSDFSFAVSANPQPKALKMKATKFTFLKMIIENTSSDETCKVLNLTMNVTFGGESK